MDPEKPKSKPPSEPSPAERRVDALSGDAPDGESPKPGAEREGSSGPGGSRQGPRRLTEKQRIEARRKRREQRGRSRAGRAGDGAGNALSRGVRATGSEIRRAFSFIASTVPAGFDRLEPLGRAVTAGLAGLLSRLGRALGATRRILAAAISRAGSVLLATDRAVTPRRALFVIVVGAALMLGVSQFLDFRATEIGQQEYGAVQDITRAPRVDVLTPFDSHSITLLPPLAIAIAAIGGAAATGRRAYGAIVALCGLAVIAVALLVDLPRALDVGEAEISYSEVAAVLLSGFWLELAAGVVIAFGGLALLALGSRGRPRRSRTAGPAPRSGRRSRDRRPQRPAATGGTAS